MALTLSARLGLTRWSAGTDALTRIQLDGDHGKLDDLVAIDRQGLAVNRPAAGVRGTYWTSTDGPDAGVTFRDDGTAWRRVNGTRVTRVPHTFTLNGEVYVPAGDAFYVPPFPVPAPPGQTSTLVAVSARLKAGTSVTWQLRRTPVAGGVGAVIVGPITTPAGGIAQRTVTGLPVSFADEDELGLEVTAVAGAPQHLRVAALIDYRS